MVVEIVSQMESGEPIQNPANFIMDPLFGIEDLSFWKWEVQLLLNPHIVTIVMVIFRESFFLEFHYTLRLAINNITYYFSNFV